MRIVQTYTRVGTKLEVQTVEYCVPSWWLMALTREQRYFNCHSCWSYQWICASAQLPVWIPWLDNCTLRETEYPYRQEMSKLGALGYTYTSKLHCCRWTPIIFFSSCLVLQIAIKITTLLCYSGVWSPFHVCYTEFGLKNYRKIYFIGTYKM